MNIANQVLQQETNDAKKQRLMSAFQLLIQDNNVQMNRLDRPNRIKFRKKQVERSIGNFTLFKKPNHIILSY